MIGQITAYVDIIAHNRFMKDFKLVRNRHNSSNL